VQKKNMDFLPAEIEKYAQDHTRPESELLHHINRETHLKVLMPRMLSGHIQGRMLSMFSHMIKPQRILEIGTYTGYSALCMAEGLTENGKLITIDINAEIEKMVRGFFATSELNNKIDYRIGNAMNIIPTLNETFDLVFIDADKENYMNYYNLVFDKVRPGGFIIADNVLWSGKVLNDEKTMDKDTRAIREYSRMVQNDNRVENVLFPVRDGLMVCRKK
jgi:caffeoyl-CoA O-methyltransferase